MPTQTAYVEVPRDEAQRRLDTLVGDLHTFLQAKAELSDIVLDALLNTYVQVALNCGRIHETPMGLLKMADRVNRFLSTNFDVTTH